MINLYSLTQGKTFFFSFFKIQTIWFNLFSFLLKAWRSSGFILIQNERNKFIELFWAQFRSKLKMKLWHSKKFFQRVSFEVRKGINLNLNLNKMLMRRLRTFFVQPNSQKHKFTFKNKNNSFEVSFH